MEINEKKTWNILSINCLFFLLSNPSYGFSVWFTIAHIWNIFLKMPRPLWSRTLIAVSAFHIFQSIGEYGSIWSGARRELEDDGRRHLRGRHSCRAPHFHTRRSVSTRPACENHLHKRPNNDTGNSFVSHSPHYRLVRAHHHQTSDSPLLALILIQSIRNVWFDQSASE